MNFFGNTPDISQVRDRGSKKWTSLMLPEHVKFIRDYIVDQKKVPRPELDEFDLHAIEETISIAYKRKSFVTLKIWKDGDLFFHGGDLVDIDLHRRVISIDNPFGTEKYSLEDIVDVTIKD